MTTIPQLSQTMQTLLTTTTEDLASTLGYVQRPDRAKFTPSTLVQTLVYGWLAHPSASIEQLAQMAGRLGVDVSPQAIDQRFTDATATLLHQVLLASVQHVIAADPVAIPILQRFTSVRIHDSTSIKLPDVLTAVWRGCGNNTSRGTAGLKCSVQLDLLTGAVCGLDLVDGRTSDYTVPVQHAIVPQGSLRLADLGFYSMDVLAALDGMGVYWLSRIPCKSRVTLPGRPTSSLMALLEQRRDSDEWETEALIGTHRQLPVRLMVRRVPQEVADQRRRRIYDDLKDKRRAPSAAALAGADWTVIITNAPIELLTLTEALLLTRIRWQVELLFKLWKSHGRLAEWRTTKPARILCELYAKLLALVFQQWILAASSWRDPERSLFKAAGLVAQGAGDLAIASHDVDCLTQALEQLGGMIRRWARTNKRKKKPTTAQRLLAIASLGTQA